MEKQPLLGDRRRKEIINNGKVPLYWSERWKLAYITFFGCAAHFAIRTNLSVAIVCMVNSSYVNSSSTIRNHSNKTIPLSQRGTLDWNSSEQSGLLSAYFYGYLILQLPGGWLASKFGSKLIVGIGMMCAGVITLLMPMAAEQGYIYLLMSRLLAGFVGGAIYPSLYAMWGRWAPPLEVSKLLSVSSAGCSVGVIVTLISSGFLCDNGFAGGWPSIFYITGLYAILWSIFWLIFVYDSPEVCKRITEVEREYILRSLPPVKHKEHVPWKSIFTSPATLACVVGNFCTDWIDYTMLTCLPTFLHDVLKYDITTNGLFSALPVISSACSMLICCHFADVIRRKKILSTTLTRKFFQTIGYLPAAAFLIGIGFITPQDRDVGVIILCLGTAFIACTQAGYAANIADFAPRYAGIICGISNFVGTVPGMVAPLLAGFLTPNKSQEEWKHVFYVGAGICIFGAILYGLLARGNVQSWATTPSQIVVPPPHYQQVPKMADTEKTNLSVNIE